MKIIIDAFGGDNAPLEILKGCALCADKYDGVKHVLVGNKEIMEKVAAENDISLEPFEIYDAPDVIGMEEESGEIMKSKKNSSMAVGLQLLADGKGDAFLSAGNSGALVMGATFIVKRIKGIKRAAFAPVMPTSKGPVLLIDSGANIEVRPEMLHQFGIMGSIYIEAFRLLKSSDINFIGNMEARDIPAGATDVIVADGFTGNVIIKMYEGVAKELFGKIKGVFLKNFKTKLAALLLKKTDDKIYTIAEKVGYKDVDYFVNKFIEAKGCTPAKYRKQEQ